MSRIQQDYRGAEQHNHAYYAYNAEIKYTNRRKVLSMGALLKALGALIVVALIMLLTVLNIDDSI